MWGLDIVGPLRKVPEGYTHLLVAMDKFSKWVEVEDHVWFEERWMVASLCDE
jgi:hypothetical protein